MRPALSAALTALVLALGAAPVPAQPQPALDALRAERDQHWREGRAQFARVRYDLALETARKVLHLSEQLDGPAGPETGDALQWLLEVLLYRQDYREAVPVADRLVGVRRAAPDRPWQLADARAYQRYVRRLAGMPQADVDRVLCTAADLDRAGRLEQVGNAEAALALGRTALAERKKLLGFADHLYAEQLALHALRCRAALGHADEGERSLAEAREVVRALYGEQHRVAASLLQLAAHDHRRRGELPRAEELLAQAAAIFARVLGPDHATSRQALEILASVQRARARTAEKAGDLAAAAGHFEAARATWARRHGPAHWQARAAAAQAAECRLLAGLPPEQQDRLGRAVQDLERAGELADAGRAAEAVRAARAALDRLAAVAGPAHRATLGGQWTLANLSLRAGDGAAAEGLFFAAVRATAAALGAEHPDTLGRARALRDHLAGQLQARLEHEDFPEAQRLAARLEEAELLAHPGQAWRARSHEATAAHLRRLAALGPADRARLAEADRQMADSARLNAAQKFAEACPLAAAAARVRADLLGEDDVETADARHNLGCLHNQLGDFPAADRELRRALAAKERLLGREHSRYAFTLGELGVTLARSGNEARAAETLGEAADLLRRTLGPDHPEYARALLQLTNVLLSLRRLDEATARLTELEDLVARSDREDNADLLHALAARYAQAGLTETALVLYEKAGAVWRTKNDRLNYAINRDNVAALYLRLGEPDRAEPLAGEAVDLFRQLLGDRHPTTARGFANLGAVCLAQGDDDRALLYQERALRASRANLALAADTGSEAMLLTAFGHFREDLDVYLTVAERAGVPADAIWEQVLAWKGAVIARQAFLRQAARVPELAPRVEALRRASTRLAEAALTPGAAAGRRALELARDRDRLEQELTAALASRGLPQPAPPTAAEVAAVVPEGAALVDFLGYRPLAAPGKPRLLAFVARPDQPVARVDLGDLGVIDRAVAAWRLTYGRPGPDGDPGRDLRRLLWEPLVGRLAGAELVLVSPDGSLAALPFAALPGRDPGRFLVEDHLLAVLPAPQRLRSAADRPSRAGEASLLVVGDVDFGRADGAGRDAGAVRAAVPPLPGTKDEAAAVRQRFEHRFPGARVVPLGGGRADKPAVLAALPGCRHAHLATHGFFDDPAAVGLRQAERPGGEVGPLLTSGLILAGYNRDRAAAVLTALEVADLDLRGLDLAVLSACDTGRGAATRGDGVLGLQRAFQVAGARTLVVSLWPVEDAATRRLMTEFYRNLWERRMGKAEALRAAQLSFLRQGETDPYGRLAAAESPVRSLRSFRGLASRDGSPGLRSPYAWAAFVLAGDWR